MKGMGNSTNATPAKDQDKFSMGSPTGSVVEKKLKAVKPMVSFDQSKDEYDANESIDEMQYNPLFNSERP